MRFYKKFEQTIYTLQKWFRGIVNDVISVLVNPLATEFDYPPLKMMSGDKDKTYAIHKTTSQITLRFVQIKLTARIFLRFR